MPIDNTPTTTSSLLSVFFGGVEYTSAYLAGKQIWQKLMSCFSSGWNNDLKWDADAGWNND